MVTRFPAGRASTHGISAARLLVLVGVLAGLLAMHGLGNHGTPAHEAGNSGMSPTAATTGVSASHDRDASAHSSSGHAASSDPEGHSGMSMAMVGLCMAVLAGVLAAALALLRPTHALLFLRPRALLLAPMPVAATRDRDPPCLFELSILRT